MAQGTAKLAALEGELAALDRELRTVQPALDAAQSAADQQQRDAEQASAAMRAREHAVFAPWCRKVGVASVAQYEAEAVSVARQRNEKRLQFAEQVCLVCLTALVPFHVFAQEARITAALSYGRSRDTKAAKKSAADAARDTDKQLATARKKLAALTAQEDELLTQLEALKVRLRWLLLHR